MQSKQHEIGSAGSFIIENRSRKKNTFLHRTPLIKRLNLIVNIFNLLLLAVSLFSFVFVPVWECVCDASSSSFVFLFRLNHNNLHISRCIQRFTSFTVWLGWLFFPLHIHIRSKSHKTLAIIISFHVSTLWRQKNHIFGYCCSHVLSFV